MRGEYKKYIDVSFSVFVTVMNALLSVLLEFITRKRGWRQSLRRVSAWPPPSPCFQFINSGLIVMFSTS